MKRFINYLLDNPVFLMIGIPLFILVVLLILSDGTVTHCEQVCYPNLPDRHISTNSRGECICDLTRIARKQ
jgi:hypothetical protein